MLNSNLDAAYLAGLFDGEGSISFGFSPTTKKGVTHWNPHIQVTICNTNQQYMEHFQKKALVGHVYTTPNNRFRNRDCSNWQDITTWRIGCKEDIRQFLDIIAPYCILKEKYVLLCRKALGILSEKSCPSRDLAFRQIIKEASEMKTPASRGRKRRVPRPSQFE